jgi:hypothetical protein
VISASPEAEIAGSSQRRPPKRAGQSARLSRVHRGARPTSVADPYEGLDEGEVRGVAPADVTEHPTAEGNRSADPTAVLGDRGCGENGCPVGH